MFFSLVLVSFLAVVARYLAHNSGQSGSREQNWKQRLALLLKGWSSIDSNTYVSDPKVPQHPKYHHLDNVQIHKQWETRDIQIITEEKFCNHMINISIIF